MHTYHFVSKAVAPKREALKLASEELAETQKILDIAMQRLKEVEDGLKKLEMTYKQCVDKKTDLENKCKQCEARLIRADKVITPNLRPLFFSFLFSLLCCFFIFILFLL